MMGWNDYDVPGAEDGDIQEVRELLYAAADLLWFLRLDDAANTGDLRTGRRSGLRCITRSSGMMAKSGRIFVCPISPCSIPAWCPRQRGIKPLILCITWLTPSVGFNPAMTTEQRDEGLPRTNRNTRPAGNDVYRKAATPMTEVHIPTLVMAVGDSTPCCAEPAVLDPMSASLSSGRNGHAHYCPHCGRIYGGDGKWARGWAYETGRKPKPKSKRFAARVEATP
jgi:hypothetical protein